MNKLVIIGNGFDLAHGMKTRYSDFVLWYVNKIFKRRDSPKDEDLIKIKSNLVCEEFESLSQVKKRYHVSNFELILKDDFFKSVYDNACEKRWVDIELEYYKQIKLIYDEVEKIGSGIIPDFYKMKLVKLNRSFDLIKIELEKYLSTISTRQLSIDLPPEIVDIFRKYIISDISIENDENLYFLNFNYTNTIVNYREVFRLKSKINYIHGKLKEKNNPIIFGYGDETDRSYEKIEDLNENEFTRHFKSFSYLTTSNYQDLFEYLGKNKFEVHIFGHSCGLSDRVLFNHIFEHDNFDKVQLYYYQYGEKDSENDFFQKTQELSRHFKLNSKHKMRTKVVPFNESKPLTPYNPNC